MNVYANISLRRTGIIIAIIIMDEVMVAGRVVCER
jgi:hypothetical protein